MMKTTKIIYLLKQLLESLEIENPNTIKTMSDNIIESKILGR